MWKYILAFTLLVIGIVEIVLALNAGLREALMKTSPIRLKQRRIIGVLISRNLCVSYGNRYSLLWIIVVGDF